MFNPKPLPSDIQKMLDNSNKDQHHNTNAISIFLYSEKLIKGELGDIMWYIALMCKELGITMDDVAEANIDKLFGRKKRGVLQGSGDDR